MAVYPCESTETYKRLEAIFRSQNGREPNDLDKAVLTQEVMRVELGGTMDECQALLEDLVGICKNL